MSEQKRKGAVFTFGRFNPPTTGHEKLVNRLHQVSKGFGDALLFSSHSNDKLKNPLSHRSKIKFLRQFFKKKVNVIDADVRQIFQILTLLYDKKYTEIRMVVGSDRIREFDTLINKYNSVKGRHGFYKFDNIEVVSAGDRDADADDVSGMSASKMRMFAEKGDFESFEKGVPTSGKRFAKNLYKEVRKGMGIAEGTLPNYMMEDLIQEGVYDPGIFKAVFLAGGPGSGKSTVVKSLGLSALGLRVINSDKAFERGLKKAGRSLDLTKGVHDIKDIRGKAKKLTAQTLDQSLQGRLGLVFDTTSADASKIAKYRKMLDALGYESKMVHVMASLENAQKRNLSRPRKLPSDVVAGDHARAVKNMQNFKKIFGKDLVVVNNDDDLKSLEGKTRKLFSKLMSWSTSFPSNKIALSWKQQEIQKKYTAVRVLAKESKEIKEYK